MNKITLLAENCWVIRSTRTKPSGEVIVAYYCTPSTWNRAPVRATIFSDYEAAEGHLNLYHKRDRAPLGWADGSTEVIDIVPLHGAVVGASGG